MYIDYPPKRQGQMAKILIPHILHKLSSTLTVRSHTYHENNCFSLPTYDFGSKPQCIILENLNGQHKSHLDRQFSKLQVKHRWRAFLGPLPLDLFPDHYPQLFVILVTIKSD